MGKARGTVFGRGQREVSVLLVVFVSPLSLCVQRCAEVFIL